jgi:EAL domain-containing protein (putative c-di-GMP-specific phosphodiesterase class I)
VLHYLPKPTPNHVLLESVARATQPHRLARMKREALRVLGEDSGLAADRAGLEAGFERALSTMWMAFQPIVDVQGQSIFGYEALMRAKDRTLPHPGAILEAAERLGRLPDLGRKVRQLTAEAIASAPPGPLIFVNLHTRDLLDETLYDAEAGLSRYASRIVLELTERAALDEIPDVADRIKRLRARGFRIAIDDLGAGYAGLASFAAVAPEIVKLDMSLVRDVHLSAIKHRLIASMTALCEEMKIQVIAEGVETAGERDSVLAAGCKLLQGYLFAKPGPPFPAVSF